MKQKLLNSFTWRGTLLVALLSCAFSAWGQDYTQQITFASGSTIDGAGSQQYTSSAFTGYLRSVVVDCKIPSQGKTPNATVNASFDGNSLGDAVTLTSNNGSYTYSVTGDTKYGKSKTVSVTINYHGNKTLTVNSITVTYTPTTTIEISQNCYDVDENEAKTYYGTYSNSKPFVVPDGLTVHTVSANADGVLTVADYNASTTVPGGTGVMVSSSTAGEKIVKMANPQGSYSPLSNNNIINMLKPTGDTGITLNDMAATGSAFYYLTMNGDQIGFYRRNEAGSAFAMPANKAYLAISSSTGVKGYSLNDVVNGIKSVETTEAESKAIYNLAGQRVSKMQKGIYVVNGKKVLVK